MSEQQQSPQLEQEPGKPPENKPAEPAAANAPRPGGASAKPEAPAAPRRMDPVRKWVLIFSAFCLLLLAWYMVADRYTPYTTQARVNAFVVPIAPQVAGEILSVDVRTNQTVKKGELLARIDPVRYELAVASAEAQLALTRQNLKVCSSTVEAAAASLEAAKAGAGQGHPERGSPEAHRSGCPRRDFAAVAGVGHDVPHRGRGPGGQRQGQSAEGDRRARAARREEPAAACRARRLGQGEAGPAVHAPRRAERRPGDRPAGRRRQLRRDRPAADDLRRGTRRCGSRRT